MPDGEPQRRHDERKLADLSHGEPRLESGAAAIPHCPHDYQHDNGIAHQHEQGKYGRRSQLGSHGRPIQPCPEVNKEKQQQKVPEGVKPHADGIPVIGGGKGYAREKSAHLLAESKHLTGGSQQYRPRDGKQQKQLLGLGKAMREPWNHVFHQQADGRQKPDSLDHDEHGGGKHRVLLGHAGTECGQGNQGRDGRDILNDQKPDGDLAVERIDLVFVGKQLDNNNGAGKSQRHSNIGGMNRLHAECQRDQKTDRGGKDNLAEPGCQCDRSGGADQVQIELESDDKQQKGDADFGQQFDFVIGFYNPQHKRPRNNSRGQKHDNQGLAKLMANKGKQGRKTQDHGNFNKCISHQHQHTPVVKSV